jgi:hypothetical protein
MSVHRNAPCPCGSGKKFKQCHGRAGATLTRPVALPMWAIVGMVVVAAGAIFLLFQATNRNRAASAVMPTPGGFGSTLPTGAIPGEPEPAAYQYDPATNRYWDPAHRHWHNGQPPDSALRGAATITPVPVAPAPAAVDTTRR